MQYLKLSNNGSLHTPHPHSLFAATSGVPDAVVATMFYKRAIEHRQIVSVPKPTTDTRYRQLLGESGRSEQAVGLVCNRMLPIAFCALFTVRCPAVQSLGAPARCFARSVQPVWVRGRLLCAEAQGQQPRCEAQHLHQQVSTFCDEQ